MEEIYKQNEIGNLLNDIRKIIEQGRRQAYAAAGQISVITYWNVEMWGTRTLERNVATQYYGRRMACYREGTALPAPAKEKEDPMEYIKSPVVAEFLVFLSSIQRKYE